MKVIEGSSAKARYAWRASIALASALVAAVGFIPTQASAITRSTVLDRAHHWVAKRVRYSQTSYFGGYRRDCSGFVSMAWKLGRSYTSSTIHAVAHRVSVKKLKPGDAVRTPGHVALFVKWKNKRRGLYVAMEESTWGRPALHHVRHLGRGAIGLRYKRITKPPVKVASAPSTGTTGTVDTTGTMDMPGTVDASATLPTTLTIAPDSVLDSPDLTDVAFLELPPVEASVPAVGATAVTRFALVPFFA